MMVQLSSELEKEKGRNGGGLWCVGVCVCVGVHDVLLCLCT